LFHYFQPKKGDIVIDVGAGRGEDTLAFSQSVGKSGQVIAVEHIHFLTNILNTSVD